MALKLGCHLSPPVVKDRTLKLGEFLTKATELVMPLERDWMAAVDGFELYRNDELGICTRANKWNLIRQWTTNAGKPFVAPIDLVVKDYMESGYDPSRVTPTGDNPTDEGACLSDVLKLWQNEGIGGHKIGPYLLVESSDWDEVCFAMNAGVGLYCGMSLPQSAMDAMSSPTPTWVMPTNRSGKRILGGHCVFQGKYDVKGELCRTGTWGKCVPTTADFVAAYFSEIYLIFSEDFMKDGVSPAGLNGVAIMDAMEQVKKRG